MKFLFHTYFCEVHALAAGKIHRIQDTESFIVNVSSRWDETTAKFRINFSTTSIRFDAKEQQFACENSAI